MEQQDFRTYRRRGSTRESGYHTCENSTGGECVILKSQRYTFRSNIEVFMFSKDRIVLTELFTKNIGILAFGGYIFAQNTINLSFMISYEINGSVFSFEREFQNPVLVGDWSNIGVHKEISLDIGSELKNVRVSMIIKGQVGLIIDFISFDLNSINKEEFIDDRFDESFHQKTSMHIPYLYYLESNLPFDKYIEQDIVLTEGRKIVLKSCNRCGRYLPINTENEINTLSFSLHCKKRAPCVHSIFRSYSIENINELQNNDLHGYNIENGRLVTYYGHQLECKACKKFFVNAVLNPQRNPQQFKEDGLRRRAMEMLVNHLLKRNLVHFEFEKLTKKQFSEFIWEKFDKRCFKCKKEIPLDEMHLDHTMPCAYLFRLDESATCLCSTHNSQKSDNFPVDYYSLSELIELSRITNLPLDLLRYKGINIPVLELLVKNVVWFYDEFLLLPDFQKKRDGILTADKINDALKRVIAGRYDLAEEYFKVTGKYPSKSVTIRVKI